ncbi:hypothetical protein GCM10009547_23890 [Sporichthya brevicatena]|uniref:DUF3618 domain-containing protein n=1 Tax=Sporichthya brevicatena TaxID=171442 RepID=A0ABN1GV36_9ACTN
MHRPSARAVRRTATDLSDQVLPHLNSAKDTLVEDVLPKVKHGGVDLAARAGLMSPPKQRHPWRLAAIVGAVAVAAYAAWNAWKLPHASDDWAHADTATPAGSRPSADVPA